MEFIKLLSISLIIIAPFLIFLSAMHAAGFNDSFYKDEFSKYGVEKNVPEAIELHQKVMDFIKGKGDYLPDDFNYREAQHLKDVRRLVLLSKAVLYFLTGLFLILIAAGIHLKKNGKNSKRIIGKALLFGGLLTIMIAILLLLSINLNFSSSFESFHKMFFQQGTYSFDPETEIIVNIYPEELFMDLELRIAKFVAIISLIFMAIGAFLWHRSKRIK